MTRPVTVTGVIFTERVALTTGPCLEVERREPHYFVRIIDDACRTADEDAPALAQRLIDAIGLESDHKLLLENIGLCQIGAEDDLPARELEVDRQCNGPSFGRESDSSHATSSQMRVALLPGQSFECGMTACSSPAGSTVNISSGKSGRGRVQDERDEIQGSSTQTCVRTPLEVPEIRRIDAGTLRQFLSGEAELLSAMGHSPGKVARVGRTGEGCPGSGVRDVGGVGMYSSGDTRSHKAIVSRLAEVV